MPILVLNNILTPQFCDSMIRWFETEAVQYNGFIGRGQVKTAIKKSIDADITNFRGDKYHLQNSYGRIMREYLKYWKWIPRGQMYPSPFRMRRYNEGEDFYDWHTDYDINKKLGVRVATILYYLNDAVGGETEFHDGTIVEPKSGRVCVFASHWSLPHRGRTPTKGSKYIITCFVYDKPL